MTVVYPTHKVYAYLNSVRTEITGDIIGNITCGWGFKDNKELERVSPSGTLKFMLLDSTRKYIPDSSSPLSGWDLGTAIELEITKGTQTRLFRYYVKTISPEGDIKQADKTEVTCTDWLDIAAEFPIVNPGVLINQRADDVIRTALTLGIQAPQDTSLAVGDEVFPTTFDLTTSDTKIYDELVSASLSELGWTYLAKDRIYGERLVFENASRRKTILPVSPVSNPPELSGFLLKSDDSGHVLKSEDGGRIILSEATSALLDNVMMDYETTYGVGVVNFFTANAYPRRKDTSTQTLFKLDKSFIIPAGATFEFSGTYADPAGGLPVNANPSDIITPVLSTDILFKANEDGSGSDLTGNIVIVSFSPGSNGFTIRLRNGGATSGWITKHDVRGLGIYTYNPISKQTTNSSSRTRYGTSTATLDQRYKTDLVSAGYFAQGYVAQASVPHSDLKSITVYANRSEFLMAAFLGLDIGDVVQIMIDAINLDGYYFIHGVEFSISPSNEVVCKWIVKLLFALGTFGSGSQLALDMSGYSSGSNSGDAIDFGYLPQVLNDDVTSFSWSVWMNVRSIDATHTQRIMGVNILGAGEVFLWLKPDAGGARILTFDVKKYSTGSGRWTAPTNAFNLSSWVHVVVTYEIGLANDPKIYINGVSQVVTEELTPTGSLLSSVGGHFVIAGESDLSGSFFLGIDATLKDARVHRNHVLTQSEVDAIYNSGTPDALAGILDSLTFQGFYVRTQDLSQYINQTLTSSMLVRDKILGLTGTPFATPVGRTP